jgi:osmotically-inducible protein OsmY
MTATLSRNPTHSDDHRVADERPLEHVDGELRRRVFDYLRRRGIRGSDTVRLTVGNGSVLLEGNVTSSFVKRRCVDCCRHVAGVINVIDRLVVLPRPLRAERRQSAGFAIS